MTSASSSPATRTRGMSGVQHGPHANPVWSTFVFVMGMLLFLFYLETMIRPMDLLRANSFVLSSRVSHVPGAPLNGSVMATYDDVTGTTTETDVVYRVGEHGYSDAPAGLVEPGRPVLVFLHIQKTAGKAFNAHVALDLVPEPGGTPRCTCAEAGERDVMTPASCVCEDVETGTWLFSRLTVGWPCGVHAGWTELTTQCLDNELNHRHPSTATTSFRKYFLFTVLRDPVARYISEWRQVASYGQWPIKKLYCHPLEDKSYFNGNWSGVSLDDFLSCPDNPANNRQVRMLADLKLLPKCDDVKRLMAEAPDKNNSLLESAKANLRTLPFFGLLEFPAETDELFQRTFGVRFSNGFSTRSSSSPARLTAEQRERAVNNNRLDAALYQFATDLFFARLRKSNGGDTLQVHRQQKSNTVL